MYSSGNTEGEIVLIGIVFSEGIEEIGCSLFSLVDNAVSGSETGVENDEDLL